jgi:zinc transport system substrate-binding protein
MKMIALAVVFWGGISLPAFGAALEVAAGIPPAAFLVERVGGEHVRVETLIQPGQDPHTYELTPKQVQRLGRAALFFKVGLPFEDQVLTRLRAVRPDLAVIDTTRGIRKIPLSVTEGEHSHQHTAEDPHVWLSPLNAKNQAAEIAAALLKADPAHTESFRANLKKLQGELDTVHAMNLKRLKPFAGRTFYVFHPAFGYFAACYGLKQTAIEAGGKEPSFKQLRAMMQRAKADRIKVIFLQPQFNPRNAKAVAEALDAEVAPLDDLRKDLLGNLDNIGKKIERALK